MQCQWLIRMYFFLNIKTVMIKRYLLIGFIIQSLKIYHLINGVKIKKLFDLFGGFFFWFDWLISCHTLQIYHFIKFCKNNCRLFISWLVDWFIIQNCKCIVINFDQSAVFITFILIAAVLSLINNNVFQIYDCLSIGKEYTKN